MWNFVYVEVSVAFVYVELRLLIMFHLVMFVLGGAFCQLSH